MDDINPTIECWQQIFYFIATPRRDGTAPSLEKAKFQEFYLSYGEAVDALKHMPQADAHTYKIFAATATIDRVKPFDPYLDL